MLLNKEQKVAIRCDIARPTIVVAGAGTGKTKVLVERVHFLMSEHDVDAKQIKLIAFTNSTADEMQERIEQLIPQLGHPIASTFHKLCKTMLTQFFKNKYRGYQMMDKPDDEDSSDTNKNQQEEILSLLLKQYAPEVNIKGKEMAQTINLAKNSKKSVKRLLSEKYLSFIDQLEVVFRKYNKLKKDQRLWDFTDLIFHMWRRLENNPEFVKYVVSQFPYLLLDEAQDLSKRQWLIVNRLHKHGVRIFCVGDPAQSIFGFTGADVDYFNLFEEHYNNGKQLSISNNYRSTKKLVLFTNWLRKSIDPKYTDIKTENEEGEVPTLLNFRQFNHCINWISHDIKTRTQALYGDEIAVIFRNKFEQKEIASKLNAAGIPIASGSKKKGVTLLNVFKAKGKQWDCCYVIDPRFKGYHLNNRVTEKSLVYVACTRAKKDLVVCSSTNRRKVPYSDKVLGESYMLDDIPRGLTQFQRAGSY